MSSACIFCRIVRGEIPSTRLYEDDDLLAFADVDPKAPVHVLIVPKAHHATVADVDDTHAAVLGRLFVAARTIAEQQGIAKSGYRLVVNAGRDAGQSVDHIHMHILGGRHMSWPPG